MNLISTQQFAPGTASGLDVYSVRLAANDLKYYVGIFESYNHQLYTFGGSDQRLAISQTKEILDAPISRSGQGPIDGFFPDITINKNNSVGTSPNYDFTNPFHSFYAPTEMKLFLTYVSTDQTTCYIRTAYLDDVLDNIDDVPTEYVDEIEDYFDVISYNGNPLNFTLAPPTGYGDFNYEIQTLDFLNEKVYYGLTGPVISSPENSNSDTWGGNSRTVLKRFI